MCILRNLRNPFVVIRFTVFGEKILVTYMKEVIFDNKFSLLVILIVLGLQDDWLDYELVAIPARLKFTHSGNVKAQNSIIEFF